MSEKRLDGIRVAALVADGFEQVELTEPAQALRSAGAAARKLYEAGLSWPDLLPKHLFLADGAAGVLDLARMRHTRRALKRFMPRQVGRFCAKLRACGADAGDVAAFLEGLGHAAVLGRVARSAELPAPGPGPALRSF